MVELEMTKLGFQLAHKSVPTPIQLLFQTGGTHHQYNTRNRNNPIVPKHKTALFNNSFLCKAPIIYNNSSDEIKKSKSIKSLSKNYINLKILTYQM